MKKYVKPELFYERYELSQHIADCAWELKFTNDRVCVAEGDSAVFGDDHPDKLFTSDAGCNLLESDWQDYCYQPGSSPFVVHMS